MPEYSSILVTGAAGFIATHLVDCLTANGCKVIALDNLSTGRLDNVRGARALLRSLELTIKRKGGENV